MTRTSVRPCSDAGESGPGGAGGLLRIATRISGWPGWRTIYFLSLYLSLSLSLSLSLPLSLSFSLSLPLISFPLSLSLTLSLQVGLFHIANLGEEQGELRPRRWTIVYKVRARAPVNPAAMTPRK